jgi:hypothetical protein
MLNAPRKITWWIAVAIGFVSLLLLFAMPGSPVSTLMALIGLLLLIIATKISRL